MNIVPGLMGVILTMTMILFTSVAIVRERERGNLELLINTPVTSTELMIGKVVPYIAFGLFQLALIVFVGRLLFDVPVRVSVVLGRTKMPVSNLLKLDTGTVIELDRQVGEAVEIFINERLVARGEIVLVEDRLGVTMTEIIKPQ